MVRPELQRAGLLVALGLEVAQRRGDGVEDAEVAARRRGVVVAVNGGVELRQLRRDVEARERRQQLVAAGAGGIDGERDVALAGVVGGEPQLSAMQVELELGTAMRGAEGGGGVQF